MFPPWCLELDLWSSCWTPSCTWPVAACCAVLFWNCNSGCWEDVCDRLFCLDSYLEIISNLQKSCSYSTCNACISFTQSQLLLFCPSYFIICTSLYVRFSGTIWQHVADVTRFGSWALQCACSVSAQYNDWSLGVGRRRSGLSQIYSIRISGSVDLTVFFYRLSPTPSVRNPGLFTEFSCVFLVSLSLGYFLSLPFSHVTLTVLNKSLHPTTSRLLKTRMFLIWGLFDVSSWLDPGSEFPVGGYSESEAVPSHFRRHSAFICPAWPCSPSARFSQQSERRCPRLCGHTALLENTFRLRVHPWFFLNQFSRTWFF